MKCEVQKILQFSNDFKCLSDKNILNGPREILLLYYNVVQEKNMSRESNEPPCLYTSNVELNEKKTIYHSKCKTNWSIINSTAIVEVKEIYYYNVRVKLWNS